MGVRAAGSSAGLALLATVFMSIAAACCAGNVDVYVHTSEDKQAQVFGPRTDDENVVSQGFGQGTLFDFPVSEFSFIAWPVAGRLQGLAYRTSNDDKLETYEKKLTILFKNVLGGKYTGNSVTFAGLWVADVDKQELSILGGTGELRGIKGIGSFEKVGKNVYKLEIQEEGNKTSAPRFRSFLANLVTHN